VPSERILGKFIGLEYLLVYSILCFIPGGLDLILIPGLGFTLDGDRLGRGKGYYDSYLRKCRDRGFHPKTIALAYKQQICDIIPVTESDMKVDCVLCPDWYLCILTFRLYTYLNGIVRYNPINECCYQLHHLKAVDYDTYIYVKPWAAFSWLSHGVQQRTV
jgi:hypothetical protein